MKKLINRLKLLKDYFLKRTKVSGLPVELVIEATNKCNLNCIMCTRQKMKRPIGYFDFNLFKKIIDETSPFLELVYLHGEGEPLFHPDIFKMIRYGKVKGIAMGLSTNATLLTKTKTRELINSGLDYLIISIDAASSETYLKIRRGANYNQVVANTRQYLKLKKKAHQAPFTVIQFIKSQLNKHEVKAFKRIWRGRGAEIVRIKPVIDLLKENQNHQRKPTRPCFYLWRQLGMVTWNGKVVTPCCMDSEGEYSLGDITKNNLKQVWNSLKMVELRKSQGDGSWSKMPLCRDCYYPQPAFLGKMGALLLPGMIVKKNLPYLEKITFSLFHFYD